MTSTMLRAKKFKMESDDAPAQLFDFVYRDPRRIESLYAQFFDGVLSALQKRTTVSQEAQKGGKLHAGVIEGGLQNKQGTIMERSTTVLPHDTAVLDVLQRLQAEGWIESDSSEASPGSLVEVQGTVFFADKYLLSLAEMGLEILVREAKSKGGGKGKEVGTYEALRKILPKMSLAPSFYLRTDSGQIFTGTIKEDGLDEPINAYYLKHGEGGMANVRLIGYKEESGEIGVPWGDAQFFDAMRQAVGVFRSIFLPAENTAITPVVMFRVI